jgi:carbamoyltransferase
LLYSAFTAYLGFEVNEGEYKVMGLAPYGRPRFVGEIQRMVDVHEDGSLRLDLDYFGFADSVEYGFGRRFVELFGPPRRPASAFFTQATHPRKDHPQWSAEAAAANQKYADVAASIQAVTEDALLAMARAVHRRTGLTHLCLAGGVAFNSVAVGRLLAEGPFEEVFIQPAAGDAGGALGAAFYAHHILLGAPRRFVMKHAYWGKGHNAAEIASVLTRAKVPFEELDESALLSRTVDALLQGKVVGWSQGRFEWGPRALGNRSLLADPRHACMKDVINRRVKRREEFRPFAPVVTEESARTYFDLPPGSRSEPTRFMQAVRPVREGTGASLAAVNHFGTSRPQTISRDANPLCYGLLRRFGEATGHPVLLNTSFNLQGEPIVASPEDALSVYRRSDLDVLVLDHFLVEKHG